MRLVCGKAKRKKGMWFYAAGLQMISLFHTALPVRHHRFVCGFPNLDACRAKHFKDYDRDIQREPDGIWTEFLSPAKHKSREFGLKLSGTLLYG